MNSICIVDSFNYSTSHEMFNAGLLRVCTHIFSNIQYCASSTSINCLKKILPLEHKGVSFVNIPVLAGKDKYSLILKYIISSIINIYLVSKINKKILIIFNFNNVFSLRMLNIFNRILKRKIVIFCHGEMELLKDNISSEYGINAKIIRYMAINYFKNERIHYSKLIHYIVLGDNILVKLKKNISKEIIQNMNSIDHPYIFQTNIDNHSNLPGILRLGIIGTVGKGKNVDKFILLAKEFYTEINIGMLTLSAIGRILIDKAELLKVNIEIPVDASNALSRDEFNKKIAALDYVLFFYDSNSYEFTASGAVFDAINYKKPIIALRNNYFEYLFNKIDSFGILVDTIEEMILVIRNLLGEKDRKKYFFGKVKNELSTRKIAVKFKEILEKI